MNKCYHTGLPQSMCGHCNGTHPLEVEPFGGRPQDDEPHRIKGVWKGRGQTLGTLAVNPMRLQSALVGSSPYVRAPFSDWGREQAMRDMVEAASRLKPAALAGIAKIEPPANVKIEDAPARPLKPWSRWIRPEQSVEVTKNAPPRKWNVKPPEQTIKHAKDPGRSASRATSKDRTK